MRYSIVALLCTSCAADPDVIATLAASAGEDSEVVVTNEGALDAGFDPYCAGRDPSLVFIDERGGLSRLHDEHAELTNAANATCLAQGARALAIDDRGTLWASATDGSAWTLDASATCTPSAIKERVQSWAFVEQAQFNREWLYALQDGALLAYDIRHSEQPTTLITTSARWLVGNSSGILYAVESTVSTFTIYLVDRGTGAITVRAAFANPEGVDPIGVALWHGQWVALFNRKLYAFDLNFPQAILLRTLPADGPAITALAAAPCAGRR